jgi:transcriptional regulator with XRE-family HTH domain
MNEGATLILSPILWEITVFIERLRIMKATSLGEKLRAYRLERQWSQEEAAWQIGISRTQIGRLERDESRPSLETMDRIEETFGLPKGSLISDYTTTNDENGVIRGIETRLLNASLSLDELKKIALIVNLSVDLTIGWDEPLVEGITRASMKRTK